MPYSFQPIIKVDGTEKTELPNILEEVIIDTALFMPNHFSILISDYNETYIAASAPFTLGAEVEILVETGAGSSSTPVSLIKGHVTGIEVEYAPEGIPFLRVRGYDKSIRLSQGRKTRTFLSKKITEMMSSIVGDHGVTLDVDATTEIFDHFIQNNQTDWDFITYYARQNGMLVYSDATKTYVKKPVAGTEVTTLQMGDKLYRFEPRLSVIGQLTKLTADGYAQKTKAAITGLEAAGSSATFQTTANGSGKDIVATAFASAVNDRVAGLTLTTVAQANAAASAEVMRRESRFVQAEGECFGEPLIQAGTWVKVEDVGTLFEGKYFISRARHEIKAGMHTVYFSATGSEPETLYGLLSPEAAEAAPPRINGVVVAQVTNINDPDTLGRAKVKYDWLMTDSSAVESFWAPVASIGAGASRGNAFLPEVNDQVLVAFEWGDVNRPYIVGALWNSTDTILTGLLSSAKDLVDQRVIKSRSGHTITLQDKQGAEQVLVKSKSGHQILLDDTSGSENITVKDKTGNNSIIITSSSNTMTIKSAGNLVLEAAQAVTIKAQTTLTIEAKTGGATISGGAGQAKLDLQAASTSLKGVNVEVSGTAQATLKGSAMVQIQGGLVKIN
jgi:uncharacterized protein involved in type VI secretion and phage assembly